MATRTQKPSSQGGYGTRRHLRRLQRDWDALAGQDPLWAILTAPDKRGGRWDAEAFFATGAEDLARLWPEVERRLAAWDLPPPRTALDYGCGVGRIAQALAASGMQVVGLDLSPRMVGLARGWNRHPDGCRYTVAADEAPDGAPFDFIYCALVLQHVPPRDAARTLARMLRWLSPQGMAAVQIVTGPAATGSLRRRIWQRLPRDAWRAYYRLRGETDLARVPVWPLPLRLAREAVLAAGRQLREVETNGMAGPEWRSAWLWITCASR